MSAEYARLVKLGNLEDDFDSIREADWVIEAVEVCDSRIGQSGMIIPHQFVKEMFFRDLKFYRSFAETERTFLHSHGGSPVYF